MWVPIFPGGSDGKASAYNAGDPGSIPGWGRSPGEGNSNPLQYTCLENPMDGGAWWATVHGGHKESGTTEPLHFTSWVPMCIVMGKYKWFEGKGWLDIRLSKREKGRRKGERKEQREREREKEGREQGKKEGRKEDKSREHRCIQNAYLSQVTFFNLVFPDSAGHYFSESIFKISDDHKHAFMQLMLYSFLIISQITMY